LCTLRVILRHRIIPDMAQVVYYYEPFKASNIYINKSQTSTVWHSAGYEYESDRIRILWPKDSVRQRILDPPVRTQIRAWKKLKCILFFGENLIVFYLTFVVNQVDQNESYIAKIRIRIRQNAKLPGFTQHYYVGNTSF
jgi:hypothetical protein